MYEDLYTTNHEILDVFKLEIEEENKLSNEKRTAGLELMLLLFSEKEGFKRR